MSTIRDFESAPIGATATNSYGVRAMKMPRTELRWILPSGIYVDEQSMVKWGYTLDSAHAPGPTTAREALDLAWELAHEVKPGQSIPKGTRYLRLYNGETQTYTSTWGFEITPEFVPVIRTLDPVPDPEPDWLKAPAVIATTRWCDTELWLPETGGYYWECTHCDDVRFWRDLTDVTPLYPKEV